MSPFNGISSGLSVRKFAVREEHLLTVHTLLRVFKNPGRWP